MYSKTLVAISIVFLLGFASQASAQVGPEWTDRGYFNLNVGFETTSGTLNDAATFSIYEESGTKRVDQNVDSGSLFDFSVGARVWRNVSVGIGFHRGTNTSEASAVARVPHPVIFDRPREVTIAAGDLDRVERGIHLQFGYMLFVSDVLSVHLTAGPSFLRLQQELIADIAFAEQSPFTTLDAQPVVQERSDSVVGVNVGADVAYQLYDSDAYRVGAGLFIRYAGGSARITVLENSIDSDVGGLQIGLGARVRF